VINFTSRVLIKLKGLNPRVGYMEYLWFLVKENEFHQNCELSYVATAQDVESPI